VVVDDDDDDDADDGGVKATVFCIYRFPKLV